MNRRNPEMFKVLFEEILDRGIRSVSEVLHIGTVVEMLHIVEI